jgi:hypothetical protein
LAARGVDLQKEKKQMKVELAVMILGLCLGNCQAQTSQSGGIRQSFVVVIGTPFSADRLTQTTWVKLDGTPGSEVENGRFYRDSQGRSRIEGKLDSAGVWHTLEITDPVAGFIYTIPAINKTGKNVAYRSSLPSKQTRATATQLGVGESARPNIGVQTMAGFTALGHQESGSSNVTSERWVSPQLMATLMSKTMTDKRMSTITLSNIQLVEPDPQLFQPPAGYTFLIRN